MAEKPGNESIVIDAALPLVAGYPSFRPSSSLAPGEELLHAPAHKSASLQHLPNTKHQIQNTKYTTN